MTVTMPDYGKISGYMGLAVRAGQAVTGEGACVTAIRSGKAAVVLLDDSASENARKRFGDTCGHHKVPLIILPPELLEKAAGKPGRMAMAIPPGGLASKVLECVGKPTDNR